jgi:hypothetical protein
MRMAAKTKQPDDDHGNDTRRAVSGVPYRRLTAEKQQPLQLWTIQVGSGGNRPKKRSQHMRKNKYPQVLSLLQENAIVIIP